MPRLHDHALVFDGNGDVAEPGAGVGLIGRITQAVLIPQFFFDAVVDPIDREFVGNLEVAAPGLTGDLLQDFPAVRSFALLPSDTRRHLCDGRRPYRC